MSLRSSDQDPPRVKPVLTFMSLPTEVRHHIYRELFCQQQQQPLVLSRRKQFPSIFGHLEPRFHTGIFRVNRQIYEDSVAFAYASNQFQVRQDFEAFRSFGPIVKSSMRQLTIIPTLWEQESQSEIEMWDTLQQFTALERVNIWMHPERLFPTIPYLKGLRALCRQRDHSPSIALDLHIWEKHLSFDMDRLDYERSRTLLANESGDNLVTASTHLPHRQQVMRLPLNSGMIVVFGDVTDASARALDDFLSLSSSPLLAKSVLPVLGQEYNGRCQRLWYQLDLKGPAEAPELLPSIGESTNPQS